MYVCLLPVQGVITHVRVLAIFLQYLDSGHCSALIKTLPGYEDVFASHSRSGVTMEWSVLHVVYVCCLPRSAGTNMHPC